MLHQIFLHKTVIHHLQIQTHTSGTDRRKKTVDIACQQHDHRIFRRFLDSFQNGILRLHCHHLRIRNDINLIRTAVRLDIHITHNLVTHLVNADASRLLMSYCNDIRMILADHLLTGITSHTRFRLSRFALQRCRKSPRTKLLAGSRFPCKNIRVGYLTCLYRILQMPDYIVMADDVMKSCHKNHLFLPFVPSVIPGGHLSTNYNIIFCIKKTIFPYCTDFI